MLDAGDIFIGPGVGLALRAGQAVVIESWPADADSSTCLVWEAAAPSPQARYWQHAVRPAARELGQGLAQVARALAHLVRGLGGFGEGQVGGRGKAQTCMESNAR
jgi:hypothetical protein